MINVWKMSIDEECPVCFEDNFKNRASTLKCGHIICSHCLVSHTIKSIETKKPSIDCPLCRAVVVTIRPEAPEERIRIVKLVRYIAICTLGVVLPYVLIHFIVYLVELSTLTDEKTNLG